MNAKEKVNRVTVKIGNEEYIVKGSQDVKHIEKVASYVDAKMTEITLNNPGLSPLKVAILAALNLGDEFFRLQEDYESFISLLNEDTDKPEGRRKRSYSK